MTLYQRLRQIEEESLLHIPLMMSEEYLLEGERPSYDEVQKRQREAFWRPSPNSELLLAISGGQTIESAVENYYGKGGEDEFMMLSSLLYMEEPDERTPLEVPSRVREEAEYLDHMIEKLFHR